MRYRTVFDINFGKEDRGTLDGGLLENVPDDSKMILRTYNTEIFEPRIEDLPDVSPEEIRDLVAHAMRLSRAKKFSFYPIFLKIAAVFVIACAIFFAYSIRESNKNTAMLRQTYADAKEAVYYRNADQLLDCALIIKNFEKKGMRLKSLPTGDALLRCTAVFAASQQNAKVLSKLEKAAPELHTDRMQLAMTTRGKFRQEVAVFSQVSKDSSESALILSSYKNIPQEKNEELSDLIQSAMQNMNPLSLCRAAIQLKQYETNKVQKEYRADALLQKSFDMAFALNDFNSLDKMFVLYKHSSFYREQEYNILVTEIEQLKKHKQGFLLNSEQIQEIRVWLQEGKDK